MTRSFPAISVMLCLTAGAWLGPAAASAAKAPASKRKVVVLPLRNLGVDDDVAASLLGFLRAEVKRLPGITLIDPPKNVSNAFGGECHADPKCLTAAGAKLGADDVVFGTVAGMGEAYTIDLKCLRVRGPRERDARVTETLAGERELLIDGVRAAAYQLLLPAQYVGSIQVEIRESGAEIFVDGKSAGITPLKAAISNLYPGKHALKIVKRGYADFDRWVEVRFARTSLVKVQFRNNVISGEMVDLDERPAAAPAAETETETPPQAEAAADAPAEATSGEAAAVAAPRWSGRRLAALAVGSSGVALLAGGAIFGVLAASGKSAIAERQVDGGPVRASDAAAVRSDLEAVSRNATVANVLYATGAAALVAGGVLWWLDARAGASPAPGAESGAAGEQGPPVTLVPTLGGAAVVGRF